HGVGKAIRQTRGTCDRRHVHNDAASVRFHVRYGGAHAVINAFDVNGKNFVKILFRGALQIANVRDSRVVDQNVEVAALEYLVECGVHGTGLGHVAAISLCVSAGSPNFGGDGIGSFFVDVEQAYAGTAGGKSLRNRAPYAAGRPRNYGELAIQAKRV